MSHLQILAIDTVLIGYIAWDCIRFVSRYKQLKEQVGKGDRRARINLYHDVLVFEVITTLLALSAIRFDWNQFNPHLFIQDNIPLFNKSFSDGVVGGMLLGAILGSAGFIVVRLRTNRRLDKSWQQPQLSSKKTILPDLSALFPSTREERLWWGVVAIGAGISEEIVFRGWLLATLHSALDMRGMVLILTAAVVFGLAHAYQGVAGVALTTCAGILFCVLYIKTGSLLLPMLLHALIDLRFAFMPN